MSDREEDSSRASFSRRSRRSSQRTGSRRRSRSGDYRRRYSSTSSEERYNSRNCRRRRSSSDSKSSERDRRVSKEREFRPSGPSREADRHGRAKVKSHHEKDRRGKHSRRSRSSSKSRSRDGYSGKHSKKRRFPGSHRSGRDSRSYSSDRSSHNDNSEDIDGIALDVSPPRSWRNRKNKHPQNNFRYHSQYYQYRQFQMQPPPVAPFKNDGSFLEMFKKMQEEQNKEKELIEADQKPTTSEAKKPALSFIGKRRGGRVLKTGVVKKTKSTEEQNSEEPPKDAWSVYMQEVKKYKEAICDEEVKTRPLVK